MLKMLDRQQAPSTGGDSLLAVFFKAQADRDAVMLKVQAERDAMLFKLLADRAAPAATTSTSPLEMLREIKPLLHNTTAPGQFMQGIEVAKSLLQQSAPAAPQEDFTTTFATLMRTLNPQGMPGFGAPTAPPAPPPAPPPPAPPPAPTLQMDELIRMMARDRNMALRFIAEMRRNIPANDRTSSATRTEAPSMAVSQSPPTSAAPAQPRSVPEDVASSTPSTTVAPTAIPATNGPASAPVATSPSTTSATSIGQPSAAPTGAANGPESTTRVKSDSAPESTTRVKSDSTPESPSAPAALAMQLDDVQRRLAGNAGIGFDEIASIFAQMNLPSMPGFQEALMGFAAQMQPTLVAFSGNGATSDGESAEQPKDATS